MTEADKAREANVGNGGTKVLAADVDDGFAEHVDTVGNVTQTHNAYNK